MVRFALVLGSMAIVGFTGTAVSKAVDGADSAPTARGASDLYLNYQSGPSGPLLVGTTDTAYFRIEYTNTDPFEQDYFALDCSASDMPCSELASGVTLDPGDVETVGVEFTVGTDAGSSTVRLSADGVSTGLFRSASKSYTVFLPMDVTTKVIPSAVTEFSEANTATFDVENTTSTSRQYTISCDWGGVGSCTPNPASPTIGGSTTTTVTATFEAGAAKGDFEISLSAEALGASHTAIDTVSVAGFNVVNLVADTKTFYAVPSAVDTSTFTVLFPHVDSADFVMSVQCGTPPTCSVLAEDDTVTVGNGPETVRVSHTAGGNGTTRSVTLKATKIGESAVTASATMDVAATSQILLSVDDANPGMEMDRSQCLTIAAGAGSIVCGDFQYVYPFTAVTRMNRTHQLALIHNTDLVAPWGFVGANLVLPPGVALPDSIKAMLTINDSLADERTYPGTSLREGEAVRLALYWAWNSVSDGGQTATYSVTVQAFVEDVGQTPVVAASRMVSISHATRYGRGWWVAGVEKLDIHGDTLVWTGGDTSGGVYLKEGSKWIRQTRMQPDTIEASGSEYVRRRLDGGEVRFSSSGFQIKTVDRNGNETHFGYSTVGTLTRLTSISMPSVTDTIYKIEYDAGTGGLSKVLVPPRSGSTWDAYMIYASVPSWTPLIDSIVAPDGTTTGFYSSWGPLHEVRQPGGDTTAIHFTYNKVAEVAVKSSDVTTVETEYLSPSRAGSATIGWYSPRAVHDLHGRFDGPLSGATDTTAFYVTGWGAVRGIRDALGNETWIEREDEDYPGLPTRVRYPNGLEVESRYNADGLPDSIIDRSTGGVTRYAWDAALAQPDSIISPEGLITAFTYDGVGNRLTQSVGGTEVEFRYNTYGQVDTIIDPEGHVSTMTYDTLGNLDVHDPAGNAWIDYDRDALGRPTSVVSPIDANDSTVVKVWYDVMGRDTLSVTSSTMDSIRLAVVTTYDSIGRRVKIEAKSLDYDTVSAQWDTLTTPDQTWAYDGLGRMVENEIGDSLVYDLAGNLIERITKGGNGDKIEMTYDEIGRLETRHVPSKSYTYGAGVMHPMPYYYSGGLTIDSVTSVFTYDAMGNMLTADNADAEITRTYSLNGLMESEEQDLGTSGGTHLLTYDYDREGRRVRLGHPSALSPGSDETLYSYDSKGALASITDPLGLEMTFQYHLDGQLRRRDFAGGFDSLTYNAEHLLATRNATSFNYDWRGKITSAGSDTAAYSGLGHLRYMEHTPLGAERHYEWFEPDAHGRALLHETEYSQGLDYIQNKNIQSFAGYAMSGTDEVWAYEITEPAAWKPGTSTRAHLDGQLSSTTSESYVWNEQKDSLTRTNVEESKSYYSADKVLRVHQLNRGVKNEYGNWLANEYTGAFEEYLYDALGRRIKKWSRQNNPFCKRTDWCDTSTDWFIWDGNQLLWETHDGLEVGYVHAGGIDAPVEMIREGEVIFPRLNWRGLFATAVDTAGAQVGCVPVPGDCDDIAWAGGSAGPLLGTDPRETPVWYGSLVTNQQDASGLLYRRNRYYDPAAGQFTQTDPIGIAGGLNTYGYAGGDPINFSDPFGLCVEDDETCHKLVGFLREFGGEVLSDAASRLDKYQGRVYLQDGAFGGSTNARRMVLNTGVSMEEHPDGSSSLVMPGMGDLAVLLAHETLHLGEDGSFFASDGATRTGLSHPPQGGSYAAFERRERAAFNGLNARNPAPMMRLRFSVYGMLTPIHRGR